jgi:hypothetical protein
MKNRRNAINISEKIYNFLKNNKLKKYPINQILKETKIRYELAIKCLIHLKNLNLITEQKGNK